MTAADQEPESAAETPPATGRRARPDGLYISKAFAIAGVLIYLAHVVMIYFLTQNVHRLEHRILILERENTRLERRLEILNVVQSHEQGFSDAEVARITQVVDRESDRFGIDPLLILAVILTETEFKRFQVSDKGAMGLMQIRPWVGKELALRRGIAWNDEVGLFDPELNVKLGATYLFELILEFNDITTALAAYAHGETRLRHQLALGRPTPQNYSRRVMKRYRQLVAEYRHHPEGG